MHPGGHGAESEEEHTGPSGWADGESESPVKITHAFCCHEPDKAVAADGCEYGSLVGNGALLLRP